MKVEEFFNKMKDRYTAAETKAGRIQKNITIGELSVKMNFAGSSLIPTFFNAFDHLETDAPKNRSAELYFWDSESTNTEYIEEVPWAGQQRHHLGQIESYTNDDYFTLQQPGSEAIYLFNKKTNEGIYWVKASDRIPYWESDFPLRMIFHWWLKDTPYQPVHAGAVGNEDGGLLLVGKGGSGKSTSTLSCLNSPLKIAGDDYILLNTKNANAFSLFSLSKLNRQSIQLLTHKGLDQYLETESIDDKYRIKLYPHHSKSLIKQIAVKAILLPQVTQRAQTNIEKCSSAQAMLALAPTTLFQLPALREQAFSKMAGFVRSTPSYWLNLGADSFQLPFILEEFLNSLKAETKTHGHVG